MHQSFVTTLHLRDKGDCQTTVQCSAITFGCPCSAREVQEFNSFISISVKLSFMSGGTKSRIVTISLSLKSRAYTRALKSEVIIPANPHRLMRGYK